MYVPSHFRERRPERLHEAIAQAGLALLVTHGRAGLVASHVPLLLDPEPHGTAGRPMLTALLHGGVGDVAVVVTRYFGGTLLGKGGLVRAYTAGVQLGLAALPTREKVEKVRASLALGYASVDGLRRLLPGFEAVLLSEEYGERVAYRLELPASQLEPLRVALADLTNGAARLTLLEA